MYFYSLPLYTISDYFGWLVVLVILTYILLSLPVVALAVGQHADLLATADPHAPLLEGADQHFQKGERSQAVFCHIKTRQCWPMVFCPGS